MDFQALLMEADGLCTRVLQLANDGVRAPMKLVGDARFRAGDTAAKKIMLNVPTDSEFHGWKLNLFPQYRIVDTASEAATDRAFRPCEFFSTNDMYNDSGILDQDENAGFYEFDGNVTLRDDYNGEYQNGGWSVASAFSSVTGTVGNTSAAPVTAYERGLEFPVPYVVPRGKAIEIAITPNTLNTVRMTSYLSNTVVAEFRIVAVFHGHRPVWGFR